MSRLIASNISTDRLQQIDCQSNLFRLTVYSCRLCGPLKFSKNGAEVETPNRSQNDRELDAWIRVKINHWGQGNFHACILCTDRLLHDSWIIEHINFTGDQPKVSDSSKCAQKCKEYYHYTARVTVVSRPCRKNQVSQRCEWCLCDGVFGHPEKSHSPNGHTA